MNCDVICLIFHLIYSAYYNAAYILLAENSNFFLKGIEC